MYTNIKEGYQLHCKKWLAILFPAMECFVSDISAGDGKFAYLFTV